MIRFIETILHPGWLRPKRAFHSLASRPGIIRTTTPADHATRTATRVPSWGCLCRSSNPEA
jgi:hypothetical protein